MKKYREVKAEQHMFKILLFSLTALFSINGAGYSQDNAEKEEVDNSSIWKLQADSYSSILDLKKSDAKKISKAYLSFRSEAIAAQDKNIQQSRETLSKNLGKILDSDQLAGASMVLGSLNARWDSYLEILVGYNLADEELKSASVKVCNYMVHYLEARAESEKSGSRFSSVTARTLKGDLDAGLYEMLSDGQKKDWDSQTAWKTKK